MFCCIAYMRTTSLMSLSILADLSTHLSLVVRSSGLNQAEDPQNMATVVEGLHYPYSENKGADQLRNYREADLRLCFRICKTPVFS